MFTQVLLHISELRKCFFWADHKRLQIKWKQSNVCQGKLQIEENSNWRDYKPEKITADAWCNQMYCDKGISYTAESGKLKCSGKTMN